MTHLEAPKCPSAAQPLARGDRGHLDLDTDVNRYLTDFQVPDTYPQPVTPAHLLTHTGATFRQPLPEAPAANVATGYSYVDGELEAAPLTYAKMAPASAVIVTPMDMAAFMIAHLHEGEYGSIRILELTTAF